MVPAITGNPRVVVIVALVALGIGIVVASRIHPKYRATTVLVWDDGTGSDSTTTDRRLRTAVDQVEMPATLEHVRDRLRLGLTLDGLAARIEARTSTGSDLVHLSATAESGKAAARLADSVAAAFLDERASQVRELAREHANELGQQIDATIKALDKAREERSRFRSEHGVVDLPAERTLAMEQAIVLANDSEKARADSGVEGARADDLDQKVKILPRVTVLTENESRPDVRRLAESENELAAMLGSMTDDNPKVQAKQGEVAELRERTRRGDLVVRAERIVGRNPIRDFMEQNLADAASRATAAERRHDAYRDLADQAKLRVEALNQLEAEAADLDSKVTSLEARLGSLRRDQQAALDRAEVGGADLHVMSAASVPVNPIASKRRLVGALTPIIALILLVIVRFVRALRGLRPATPREIAFWTGMPVVGAGDDVRVEAELAGLAGELADALAMVGGDTLLVPRSSREIAAAKAIGLQLETLCVSRRTPMSRDGRVTTWTGELAGSALRRRVRAAQRVLVVVAANAHRPWQLRRLAAWLGRSAHVGLVVIDVGSVLADVADRAGDAAAVLGDASRA